MGKITTKKRILFSFRGQVTINGQIMSEKPGIFCAQNGQKLWVFGQPGGGVVVPVYRKHGRLYLGDGQFYPFEHESWTQNLYDGTK